MVVLRMWNEVSESWIGSNETGQWFHSIDQFVVTPKWIPKGMDSLTHEGILGFGENNDLLPMDVNVTFFFDYVKATVETIEIFNHTAAGTKSLGKWNVTDKFNTRDFRISVEFPYVGICIFKQKIIFSSRRV